MAQEGETKDDRPFDPEEVRRAFGTLSARVTGVEDRLTELEELVRRAQRLALSAERRADVSRLDAHAAEVKAVTCKLDMDNSWRFTQKALEDIVSLSGRVRMLEDADRTSARGDPEGGDGDSGA